MKNNTWQNFATIARGNESYVLSVLCKKTYGWNRSGTVFTVQEQKPLTDDIKLEKRDDRNGVMVTQGRDLWALKVATDVVVMGNAHVLHGIPVHRMTVSVDVGNFRKEIAVFGNRHIIRRGTGNFSFSSPELFTTMELSWWNAYGGVDPMVLPKGKSDTPIFAGKFVRELFPGVYPRNPCGTGYLIKDTPELAQGMLLPNLEDPKHLLRPEHFLVGNPENWWQRPLPQAFSWVHPLWFPRCVHSGALPYFPPPINSSLGVVKEIEMGLVSTQACVKDPTTLSMNVRFTNEAAPDLILPFLRGDEAIRLRGFHSDGDHVFRLPREIPKVEACLDGRNLGTGVPYLHTLCFDTEKREFFMLWSLRFTLPEHIETEFAKPPPIDALIPRFDVRVDGYKFEREQWPEAKEKL